MFQAERIASRALKAKENVLLVLEQCDMSQVPGHEGEQAGGHHITKGLVRQVNKFNFVQRESHEGQDHPWLIFRGGLNSRAISLGNLGPVLAILSHPFQSQDSVSLKEGIWTR